MTFWVNEIQRNGIWLAHLPGNNLKEKSQAVIKRFIKIKKYRAKKRARKNGCAKRAWNLHGKPLEKITRKLECEPNANKCSSIQKAITNLLPCHSCSNIIKLVTLKSVRKKNAQQYGETIRPIRYTHTEREWKTHTHLAPELTKFNLFEIVYRSVCHRDQFFIAYFIRLPYCLSFVWIEQLSLNIEQAVSLLCASRCYCSRSFQLKNACRMHWHACKTHSHREKKLLLLIMFWLCAKLFEIRRCSRGNMTANKKTV